MGNTTKAVLGFTFITALMVIVGQFQSWSLALAIINMCLISAVMALGVNIQWGYAGLFNVGIMGFAALGGMAAVLVSAKPVTGAWKAGGMGILLSIAALALLVVVLSQVRRRLPEGLIRNFIFVILLVGGVFAIRAIYDPAVEAIESFDPARTGFLGGLGAPILFSWFVGGCFAAAAAWFIGRIALGLRSDYLAIATLGISEIVIAIVKNEDWLTRGVKNVSGLPRPVPYEINLQQSDWFIAWVERIHHATLNAAGGDRADVLKQLTIESSSIFIKLCYSGLFLSVLLLVLWLAHRAQKAPWGRMMRAIRDNEVAANAMGKDVTRRHLQVFVVGSAVVGIAGAMLTTLEGQFTPGTYNPLRFTFLIWVMVIVGGSGNNLGAVLGAFLIWFFWIEAEPMGIWLMENATVFLGDGNPLREHLINNAAHMRLMLMGIILLLVLRFSPKGLLPERVRRPGSSS
ncbi:MAG: branched-chain amino acid ABC transporter permease [Gammaproteobacteria bacterium]|nr:branched-chain amino acid ABC transporter permease [Gammaproteobacteria bacterium]